MSPQDLRPIVVVFSKRLLPLSETFVVAQAEAMRRWRPIFAGPLRTDPSLPLPESYAPPFTASRWKRAWRVLRTFFGNVPLPSSLRPKIVHAHFGPSGVLAMAFAARQRVPLVVTFHGFDTAPSLGRKGLAGFAVRLLYRQLFRRVKRLVAVSDHIAERLVALGAPAEKVVRLYTGISLDAFPAPPPGPRPARVLFVGRMVAFKGAPYLLEAYERLVAQRPGLELVLVGDGAERAGWEAASRHLPGCRFVGWQSPEAVRRWMQTSQVFCGPSVFVGGRTEGLGHVFLEAQASETPCVAFRAGGVPEAIEDGVTGLLAAPGDVQELTECLARLLDDERLRARMGKAGRNRVAEHFDIDRQTARLETLYEEWTRGPGN